MQQPRSWNWLLYPAVALGLVVMAGSGFMVVTTRAYNIPAASMRPSLEVGDYIFAWSGYYMRHEPERGDIALFLHGDTVFVKRVIGLPGDTIQMKAGRLWINGTMADRQDEDGMVASVNGNMLLKRYRETLPNGVSYSILEQGDTGLLDDTPPFQVEGESYFVMGDNRDNSNDSRVLEFGTVPRDTFMDRPFIIYFSHTFSRIGMRVN